MDANISPSREKKKMKRFWQIKATGMDGSARDGDQSDWHVCFHLPMHALVVPFPLWLMEESC